MSLFLINIFIFEMENQMLSVKKFLSVFLLMSLFYSCLHASEAKTLHEAADAGNLSQVKLLLNTPRFMWFLFGIHVDIKDKYGKTPLHRAAAKGHTEVVKYLVEQKALVTSEDDDKLTPLFEAATNGHHEIVSYLCQHGAKVNTKTTYNYSPLYMAAYYGHHQTVQILCHYHAEVDSQNWLDCTPLYIAVTKGHKEVVQILCQHGANVNSRNLLGCTPLYLAATKGHKEVVQILCQHGANVDSQNGPDCTPLYIAAEEGHKEVVQILCQHGANVDRQNSPDDCTPLYLAATKGHKEVVQILCQHGANVNSRNGADQLTPLFHAIEFGHKEIVQILCAHKPEVDVETGKDHLTPLYIAARDGRHEILEILAQHTTAIDKENGPTKYTALEVAALNGHLKCVEILCQKHANVNHVDSNGIPLIFCPAQNGHHAVLEVLLANKAEVDKECTITKTTALEHAAQRGHVEVIRILLQHGANPKHQNQAGKNALLYAIENNQPAIALLLLDRGAPVDDGDPLLAAINHNLVPVIESLLAKKAPLTPAALEAAQRAGHDINRIIEERARQEQQLQERINAVVQAHQARSQLEDDPKIQRTQGPWHWIPSLQQTRQDGTSTLMCGYYALYNALNFFAADHPERMLDRQQFCTFLEPAVRIIAKIRKEEKKGEKYENLQANELKTIINELYHEVPVMVIEKKHLLRFLQSIVTDINEAFEVPSTKNYLDQFLQHKIEKFAIIAGLGDGVGHWFTIGVERKDNVVVFTICDSLKKVLNWDQDAVESAILPFYLAANNKPDKWKNIFLSDIKKILFNEYPAILEPTSTPQAEISPAQRSLQVLIERIDNLIHSLNIFAEREKITENEQIITLIRIRAFSAIIQKLVYPMFKLASALDALNPLRLEVIPFCTAAEKRLDILVQGIQELHLNQQKVTSQPAGDQAPATSAPQQAASSSAAPDHQIPADSIFDTHETTEEQQKREHDTKRRKTFSDIAQHLFVLAHESATLRDKMKPTQDQQTQPETVSMSYEQDTPDLDPEFMECIKQGLPTAILELIGKLSLEHHEPTRVLFVGPPGNGKTTIAQFIARQTNRPFLFIRSSGLGNSYQFSRENQIKSIRAYIEQHPTAVILFDEIDALAENSDQPQRAAEQLQALIDDAQKEYSKVVFIGTTNYKEKIPGPVISRFAQNIITINNPDTNKREAIIHYKIMQIEKTSKEMRFRLPQEYITDLVKKTEYFSIRDIESIFANAQGKICAQRGKKLLHVTPETAQEPHDILEITKDHMKQAHTEILATIIRPPSRLARAGQAILSVTAASYPYINAAISVGGFLNSLYSTRQAAALHAAGLKAQKALAKKSYAQQEKMHEDSKQLQAALHQEGLKTQKALADESNVRQAKMYQSTQQHAQEQQTATFMQGFMQSCYDAIPKK